jgi:hypothetical protein
MVSTAVVNGVGRMYAIATTERARESKIDRMLEVHNEKQG